MKVNADARLLAEFDADLRLSGKTPTTAPST
jgi:hypothetical protein